MTLGRLFAVAIALLIGWWVITKSGWFGKQETAASQSQAPIERARDVSRKSAERSAAREGAQNEADSAAAPGVITENMTPEQVRKLLGSPSDVQTETTDSGARREKWIYSSVGKTVIFENGTVVSIQ
jgi:hypothetical protein